MLWPASFLTRGFVRQCCSGVGQNVDRLHHAAGSKNVVELHGDQHHVICMTCKRNEPRSEYQARLEALNPQWTYGGTFHAHGSLAAD